MIYICTCWDKNSILKIMLHCFTYSLRWAFEWFCDWHWAVFLDCFSCIWHLFSFSFLSLLWYVCLWFYTQSVTQCVASIPVTLEYWVSIWVISLRQRYSIFATTLPPVSVPPGKVSGTEFPFQLCSNGAPASVAGLPFSQLKSPSSLVSCRKDDPSRPCLHHDGLFLNIFSL